MALRKKQVTSYLHETMLVMFILTSPACPPVEVPVCPPEDERGEVTERKLSVSERVEAILQSLSLPKSPSSPTPELTVEPPETEDVKLNMTDTIIGCYSWSNSC